jgi:hypothetical protein
MIQRLLGARQIFENFPSLKGRGKIKKSACHWKAVISFSSSQQQKPVYSSKRKHVQ